MYGSGVEHNIPFKVVPIGAIWFLLAIIFGTYITQEARTLKSPSTALIALAFLGWWSSLLIWLPWSVQSAMTASIFIYIGVILKNHNVFTEDHAKSIFPMAFALWINEIIHDQSNLSIVRNYYPNGAFDFIGGGAGAICVIIIIKYLYEKLDVGRVWNFLKWAGENSLTILCLHLIELNMIPWDKLFGLCHLQDPGGIVLMAKLTWAIGGTWMINHTRLKMIFRR